MLLSHTKKLVLLFCLAIPLQDLQSQIHDLTEEIVRGVNDTVREVRIFYPVADKKERSLADTTFSMYHMQYDPAREGDRVGFLNASYLGSQVFRTYYMPEASPGFEVGHDIYDLYKFNIDSAAFYDARVAYTDLFYAQSNQAKTQTEADFGTSFGDQYISLGYRRVNNTGDFQNQESIHTSLYLGYHLKKDWHDLTLLFGSNVIQDKYNGGITTDSLFSQELAGALINIPTLLTSAEARHQNRQYLAQWKLRFENIPLFNELKLYTKWSNSYVKVFDTNPQENYYEDYYIDEQGLRQFIQWKNWQNKVVLSNNLKGNNSYGAGIQYNRIQLYQEPETSSFSELFALGFLDLQIGEFIKLNADAQAGLQNDKLEWELQGQIQLETGIFDISGRYQSSSTLPDLVERKMILRHDLIYDQGLDPLITNTIGGTIKIPALDLKLSTDYHNLINYRYWMQGNIAPSFTDLNILQMKLSHHLNIGIFHLDNLLSWQILDRDRIPLPEWQGRHQLYIETQLFRSNMHIRTGLEGRYYLNYTPPYYQPFYGEFFVGEETPFGTMPYLLDYFLGFRVQTFHFLLRVEHLPMTIQNDRFYSHYKQPYSNFGFRFGVRWRLNN